MLKMIRCDGKVKINHFSGDDNTKVLEAEYKEMLDQQKLENEEQEQQNKNNLNQNIETV